MAVPQPLLNQRPILEPSKIEIANAFTREDVVSAKTLLDFAHLYNFFKNQFWESQVKIFNFKNKYLYVCVIIILGHPTNSRRYGKASKGSSWTLFDHGIPWSRHRIKFRSNHDRRKSVKYNDDNHNSNWFNYVSNTINTKW